jgi:AcrR family transcriptional regulator
MAKLSKVDAAKAAGVSRQTLYTYIKDSRLSVDADGLIDTAELLRAGFTLRTLHEIGRPIAAPVGQTLTSRMDTVDTLDVYQDMIAMLKQQLSEAQAREQAAREREALLLQMLHETQQQNQRLLDMPRSAPVPASPGPGAPGVASALRGDMRRRIVALLQEYPEGLSPVQTRQLLGIDKDLGQTMKAMARDGLLRRVETGWYVVGD